jgi:hypothetical protein
VKERPAASGGGEVMDITRLFRKTRFFGLRSSSAELMPDEAALRDFGHGARRVRALSLDAVRRPRRRGVELRMVGRAQWAARGA